MIKKSRNLHKTSFSLFNKLRQTSLTVKVLHGTGLTRTKFSYSPNQRYVSMQQFPGFYRRKSSHYSLYGQPNFIQMLIALERETYWCLRHLEMCRFYSNIHSRKLNQSMCWREFAITVNFKNKPCKKSEKTFAFIQLACLFLSLALYSYEINYKLIDVDVVEQFVITSLNEELFCGVETISSH